MSIKCGSFTEKVKEATTEPVLIVVKGREKNREVTYKYYSSGGMAPGTGVAASLFAQMVWRGEIKDKGVVTPEQVDPKSFFGHFGKRGFFLHEEKTSIEDIRF